MKRITVLLILLGLLTSSIPSVAAFASAEPTDGTAPEQVTEGETPTDPEAPAGSENPEPPATGDPEPPTEPETGELPTPPVTEPLPPETGDTPPPPSTEPLPPETEEPPAVDYDALLFEGLCSTIDSTEPLYSLSTPEPLETELLQAVCSRALERVARFFYLKAVDISIVTLPAPDAEGNLYRYDLRPVYSIAPGEELDTAKAFVEQECAAILGKLPANATPTEQALFLHDYICTAFAYDGTHSVGDLYNLLQSKHGVCRAYVSLYAYLLDLLGIPNDFATSAEMNHIWNLVQLDGNWYHVDLTHDDPTVDHPGRVLHTNFLRSDAGITETGHYNWTAPYVCDSDFYETSFLPDLAGKLLFLSERGECYAVNKRTRSLQKVDLTTLTAETVVDLSGLRWEVWEHPGVLYKDQFINLCYDGYLIYFNGPDAIWGYDPDSGQVTVAVSHHPSAGYLYSLDIEGHKLICSLGRAPSTPDTTVEYATPHRYGALEGELFTRHICLVCGHTEHFLTPADGSFFIPLLSYRSRSEATHDLRLLLLVHNGQLSLSSPLTVTLTLHTAQGDQSVTTLLGAENYGLLLVYERVLAGGKEYTPAQEYTLLGLILQDLDNDSYDSITLQISEGETILYSAQLPANQLFPPPPPLTAPDTKPPDTEPPVTEPPVTSEPVTDLPSTVAPITGNADETESSS